MPSVNDANKPNAGSSSAPDRKPEAKTKALPPPSSDNGAKNAAKMSPPAGATPRV